MMQNPLLCAPTMSGLRWSKVLASSDSDTGNGGVNELEFKGMNPLLQLL
jgi:hypothetical protein